jgi:hypothetical protein
MLHLKVNFKEEPKLIQAREMQPMQIGMICDEMAGINEGHIVMRTQSRSKFELMNLSNPKTDRCWTNRPTFMVELLQDGQSITLSYIGDV